MSVYKPWSLNIIIRYKNYYVSYLPGLGVVDPPGVGVAGFGVVDVSSPKFYRLNLISTYIYNLYSFNKNMSLGMVITFCIDNRSTSRRG